MRKTGMHRCFPRCLGYYFQDVELSALWLLLGSVILLFSLFGKLLAPVLVAVVIAYLLKWPIHLLKRLRLPSKAAVWIIYVVFLGVMILGLGGLIPLLIRQLSHLISELPSMATRSKELLMHLPHHYPNYISPEQIQTIILQFKLALVRFSQWLVSISFSSIPTIISGAIYLVLVPLLVYYFLIDQEKILQWVGRFLPKQRRLIKHVWDEVYAKTGNYVLGKVLEMGIVGFITFVAFSLFGLQYAALLSVLVGISVAIPYLGAVIVTVPILIIAFVQWGWDTQLFYLMTVYTAINLLDAHLLAPLLFAEAVDLHPVALIVAVLFFGKLLGVWGVFFAIPLAALVKALLDVLLDARNPLTQSTELPH